MDRDRILRKNISLSVLYKILNMAIVYLTIPIILKYLGSESYGVWVTILSIINIVIYLDGGILNGLKTRLSESLVNDELEQAKHYISSAYFILIFFSILLLVLGALLIYLIDLKILLNTTVNESTIKGVFFIVLVTLLLAYILNLYKPLFYAHQKSALVELSMLIYQSTVFFLLFILLKDDNASLIKVAIIYGVATIGVGSVFTFYFFKKNNLIVPSIFSIKKESSKILFGLSLDFFIIQLCMIVIFSTDNIIISNLLGPEEVTKYDVVLKIFQVIITFMIIISDPYWTMYANAYKKGDIKWISKTLKKWNLIFLTLILLILLMIIFIKPIVKIWLQKELFISTTLIYFMALFVLIRIYGIIYMYFLNGIGKVKIQMWLYLFGAIINIPLSIYFVQYFNLGSSGVILGTVLSILPMSIILPLQANKILKTKK
jgi:O-antigen/teichoic acid export membrane protein